MDKSAYVGKARAISGNDLPLNAVSGFLLGLSAITRPDVLLFGIPALVFLWIRPGRRRWRTALAAAFIVAAAIPVGTVAVRNYAVSGERVLVSANGGANFYIGNHPAYVQSSGMWSAQGVRPTALSAAFARRRRSRKPRRGSRSARSMFSIAEYVGSSVAL